MSEFKDKVVLITGAGGKFGQALLKAFSAEGAWVAANDLTDLNLDSIVEEIIQGGGKAQIFINDISKKLALQTTISEVLEAWERIDILVNHASVQPQIPLLDMDEWDWRRTMDVNLTGTFLVTQSVGRVMRELGGGTILNVGPVDEGLQEVKPRAAYLASKAGVVALTQAAAQELAPFGIRVNAVCPQKDNLEEAAKKALELCRGQASGEVVAF